MKDGRCPVCNSNDVYTSEEYTLRANGQVVELSVWIGNDVKKIYFQPFICRNCRHTEFLANWPEDLSILDKDKQWHRVSK